MTPSQIRKLASAPSEKEKIQVASAIMIEKPLELIRAILMKHEGSVIEIMRELSKENDELRKKLGEAQRELQAYKDPGVALSSPLLPKGELGRNSAGDEMEVPTRLPELP